MMKSPSFDQKMPHQASMARTRGPRNSNGGLLTMSHRANLDMSAARTSNRGIVTMQSHNGLQSGNLRVRSGRRRSSALSHRSVDSSGSQAQGHLNQAVNGFYDRNMGKKYERFR